MSRQIFNWVGMWFSAILLSGSAVADWPVSNHHSLAQLIAQTSGEVEASEDKRESAADEDEEKQEAVDKEAEVEKAIQRNTARLARLRKPLSDIRIEATAEGEKVPVSEAAELLDDQVELLIAGGGVSIPLPDRYTIPLCHRPLYFEELNLERCGNTYGCATNFVSAAHFLTNTVALPYRLATDRADCPVPCHGDCLSCQAFSHDIEPFGCEPRAALIEAAAIAGFIILAM